MTLEEAKPGTLVGGFGNLPEQCRAMFDFNGTDADMNIDANAIAVIVNVVFDEFNNNLMVFNVIIGPDRGQLLLYGDELAVLNVIGGSE